MTPTAPDNAPGMPPPGRARPAQPGHDDITASRNSRLDLGDTAHAAVYLQGVNEATHGIADSLLSVLAARSAEITGDILAHRADHPAGDREPALVAA